MLTTSPLGSNPETPRKRVEPPGTPLDYLQYVYFKYFENPLNESEIPVTPHKRSRNPVTPYYISQQLSVSLAEVDIGGNENDTSVLNVSMTNSMMPAPGTYAGVLKGRPGDRMSGEFFPHPQSIADEH